MRQGPRAQVQSLSRGDLMASRVVVWSMLVWLAMCCAPYVYALNDLITWR